MGTIIFTTAGAVLLLLVAYDVYSTVLHSSARYGPVGEGLNRAVWRVARKAAFSTSRKRRHKLLNAVGPALMPLLIVTYIVLLTIAFALIYVPHVPDNFILVAGTKTDSVWLNAVYFSGCTLTTLGYGDIVPRTGGLRFVALIEAASGFALISLAITYLLAVNTALERKRTVALSLYHQAGEGADAAGYIAHHFVDGRFYGLRDALRTNTRDIQALLESHVEHPVIHYFHPVEVYRSLPRILFLLLETCSVIRTSLDREESADLRNFPEVRTLEASARHVLSQLVESLELERRMRPRKALGNEGVEDERRWRRRFGQTLARLKESGIKARDDREQAWEEYRAQREEWESKLERLSLYLGFDWEEVTGDRDLEEAAGEPDEGPRDFTLG
ncbi:MAG TPA: potassium channel family protein [Pyrinomonadaceae bacterium]|nr:potassium channel family protein [Pyrinomonadaceae bacterium]